MSVTETTNCWS